MAVAWRAKRATVAAVECFSMGDSRLNGLAHSIATSQYDFEDFGATSIDLMCRRRIAITMSLINSFASPASEFPP